jgi:type 1 glutamine amidotransferase
MPENSAVPLGWLSIVDETRRKRKAACTAAFRWHWLRSICFLVSFCLRIRDDMNWLYWSGLESMSLFPAIPFIPRNPTETPSVMLPLTIRFSDSKLWRHGMGVMLAVCCLSMLVNAASAQEWRALILDGQNNHEAWPKTTMMVKKYFEDTGRFRVDIARTKTTWQGEKWLEKYPLNDGVVREPLKSAQPDPDYRPDFSKYQVVISNLGFGAAPWPEATKQDFEKYVANGGGFVVLHAADNSFGDWPEFNKMIGLGGWGGRNEKSGPYVYLDADEKLVRDTSPGNGGSHGSQHEFAIVVRQEHPITHGLPRAWLHTQDELYDRLRGPAENMTILATAFASPEKGGTGRHEPMIMTIDYGKGRVFHTPMGHADYSMECVGFITVLIRGTEWAATGKVTLDEVPKDFPTLDASSKRPF